MRSNERSRGPRAAARDGDLTAAARIRDAAILRFSRDGFGVSLRTVAEDAQISGGLILYHFGTKEGLRRACDEWVLAEIRESKRAVLGTGETGPWLAQLGQTDHFAPLAMYVARTLQAGGEAAAAFFDHLVDDAAGYLEEGVRNGVITPSRDPYARARFLTGMSVGTVLLEMSLRPQMLRDGDFTGFFQAIAEATTGPGLELYTQGLLTDRQMLDDYLMYVTDPPARADDDGDIAAAQP
jgi:AcrR family transcriptional regulator